MRFPLALTYKIAKHITRHRLQGTPKFAMVLQLEPLHTCNLTCTGCGRIREYSTSLKDMVSLDRCLAAAEECDAPMVSVCGGEPLIYPHIEALIAGLRKQRRIIYVCTNGVFMRKKMREYMAAHWSPDMEATLKQLEAEQLVLPKEAEAIRNADFTTALAKALHRPAFVPTPESALRLIFGEFATEALLPSARVVPEHLLKQGFRFAYGDLESALRFMLGTRARTA